jgi:hypothetical protein
MEGQRVTRENEKMDGSGLKFKLFVVAGRLILISDKSNWDEID